MSMLVIFVILCGYAVKMLMIWPGVFKSHQTAERYHARMTGRFKYINVCMPSASEDRCVVLRNLVGALSSIPPDCLCPFHVVFLDEGHRHGFKGLFVALERVVGHDIFKEEGQDNED